MKSFPKCLFFAWQSQLKIVKLTKKFKLIEWHTKWLWKCQIESHLNTLLESGFCVFFVFIRKALIECELWADIGQMMCLNDLAINIFGGFFVLKISNLEKLWFLIVKTAVHVTYVIFTCRFIHLNSFNFDCQHKSYGAESKLMGCLYMKYNLYRFLIPNNWKRNTLPLNAINAICERKR